MEVRLVCDCEDCYSTLIQVGCVNILLDIPFKLLHDFSEGIAESPNCNFTSSCELYDKLNCSQIHVVLITHSRGFQGLNLLGEYYDLSSTHIVCTRPVYVLSNIYYSAKNRKNGVTKRRKSSFYGFGTRRLISNLRETRYRSESSEFSLLDFVNGNLLHTLSYNEPLKIDLTVSSAYTRHGPLVNALDSGRLNDFSVQLNVVATSSGYCLGSCNYLIKHENVRERIVYVSKSSTRNRYTRSFDYSIFDDVTPEDVIIVANTASGGTRSFNIAPVNISNITHGDSGSVTSNVTSSFSSVTTKVTSSFNSGNKGNDSSNINNTSYDGVHNGNSDNEMELKSERKRRVKEELFSDSGESDSMKVESDEPDRPLLELEKVSLYCINAVLNGHNAILPVDFNYEYLVDLFESLNQTIKMKRKQIYVYCVGDGVEEMFDYLDKCCDWVETKRSELTMHSEDPKSPFPDLEEMKNNNQFFYSDSLSGLSSVFREPSVLVTVVKDKMDFMDYLTNENNRFLILQSKYYPLQPIAAGSDCSIAESNTSAATVGASGRTSYISKCVNDRCVCTSVNLQTNMTNINVNAKLVVLSKNNGHCKLHLDEVNVGYIRAGVKPEVLEKLEFIDLFAKGGTKSSGSASGYASIQFNKFKVDCSNIEDVVLTHLQNDTETREVSTSYTISTSTPGSAPYGATNTTSAYTPTAAIPTYRPTYTASVAKTNTASTSERSTTHENPRKSRLKNQPKSEYPVSEISEDVNDAFLFGTYNYSSLVTELSNYFTEKIHVTKTKEGVTLTNSNFKISIGADAKSTLIETVNDTHRRRILKSLQQLLISI